MGAGATGSWPRRAGRRSITTCSSCRDSARLLEKKLDVDVADNFRKGKLARAGFPNSGVSGQNRLVERHDAALRGLLEELRLQARQRPGQPVALPARPARPGNQAKHPYPDQAFKHDGGEIIFNLPNGLQGYLLVNGKDERIDDGPIDVVNDDQRTSGTPEIVNGVSCMACHVHGMMPKFKDYLRDHSAVFGEAETKVRQLYPAQETHGGPGRGRPQEVHGCAGKNHWRRSCGLRATRTRR